MPFVLGAVAVVVILLLATEAALGQARDPNSIRVLAQNAGFSGPDLDTAVAIAQAESSGFSDVVGDLTLGTSIGLWQINLRWHPEYTREELMDPQTNANAAFAIYRAAGNSFKPWSTFKTGAYLQYLGSGDGTVNT